MTTRRTAKLAEAVRESVSTTVLFGLKDPRVKNVTVLRAEMSPDLRAAKVYFTVRGTDKDAALCLHGLQSARGFIQAKLADRLQTRYTPILTFVLDDEVKKSITASAIISKLLAESGTAPDDVLPADGVIEAGIVAEEDADDLFDSADEESPEDNEFSDDEFADDDLNDGEDEEIVAGPFGVAVDPSSAPPMKDAADPDSESLDGLDTTDSASNTGVQLPGLAAGESTETTVPPAPS